MRIFLLVHSLRKGGAERVVLELALGLRSKGHAAEVVSWLDVDDYDEERYRPVPRHFLMKAIDYRWPRSVPSGGAALRRLARRLQPQAIEIHTPTVAWVAGWAKVNVPHLHVIQGFGAVTRRGSLKDWGMRMLDRAVQRRLDATFVVPTLAVAEAAKKHFRVGKARFTCVANGTDVVGIPYRRNNLEGAPIVMMLGTLSAAKGQAWGVKAMAVVRREIPQARLLIVGEGPHRPGLERLVHELGLERSVELTGRRPDAFDLMAASHVFWHLSESEGLPLVVLEAMATGLPVVGFDVRGTRDAVVNGETGYLAGFGDVDTVARRTIALLGDESLYRRLSLQARRRVEHHFSIAGMVTGHERALDDAVKGRLR